MVESVATLVDSRNFEALEDLYANTVEVDYTSLAGGEPETLPAKDLMKRWAAVLPGFDRTRHAISEIAVSIDGIQASATAHVVARHYLEGKVWEVKGHYLYRMRRDGAQWRIVFHRFTLTGETGSRDLITIRRRIRTR